LNQVTLNEVIANLAALRDGQQPVGRDAVEPKPAAAKAAAARAEAPRIAENPPAPEPMPETAPANPTLLDFSEAWRKTVEKVRATRRLIAGWVEAGTALGIEGRFLLVGFPPDQKTAMESLSIPKTRDYIDAVLKEVGGGEWKIKFIVKEGLPGPAAPETTALKKPETQATFKDDPLIREALEIFKGEIKTASD
jgi:hypothetical protein